MTQQQFHQLISQLQARFNTYPERHKGITWAQVLERLAINKHQLVILNDMALSGGEPDVIGVDPQTGEVLFCDCSAESPAGRRSLCYNQQALDGRKQNNPGSSVVEAAAATGVALLNEEQLQTLGEFDKKTSSWIQPPYAIRKLGGALFCNRRYDQVFTYHDGADSYYAARGFRGLMKI